MNTINKECNCIPTCVDNSTLFISGICDPSKINFNPYNYWTEIAIPGMVWVPNEKPSIEQLDSVSANVQILRKKVIVTPDSLNVINYEGKLVTGRKLIVEGLICMTVSYVSTNTDQSVHSFHGSLPFSAYIVVPLKPIPNSDKDALLVDFTVVSCLEDIFVQEFCGRNMTLNATLLLQAVPSANACNTEYLSDSGLYCAENKCDIMSCACECSEDEVIVKGICPEDKIKGLLTDASRYWTETYVPEVLNVPCYKPNIEQLISVTTKLDILCQKVIRTPIALENQEGTLLTGKKLVVEAILRQKIVYVSSTKEQSVHAVHFDVPFSTYIVVPVTTNLTDKFKLFSCIEDIFACALNERQIFKNVTIFLKAKPIVCPLV